MIQFHPEFLKKDGKNEFVVLPYDEFLAIQDLLSDAEDLMELRHAKAEERDEPTVSLAEVRKKFGLDG